MAKFYYIKTIQKDIYSALLKSEAELAQRAILIYDANFYTQLVAGAAVQNYNPMNSTDIYIPIHPGVRFHWYLLIIKNDEQLLQIWDSGNVDN